MDTQATHGAKPSEKVDGDQEKETKKIHSKGTENPAFQDEDDSKLKTNEHNEQEEDKQVYSNGTEKTGYQNEDESKKAALDEGDDPAGIDNNVKFGDHVSRFEYKRSDSDGEKGHLGNTFVPAAFNSRQRRRRSSLGPEIRAFKMNIWKNLLVASLGMMGIMSAYDMLRYVESSLNAVVGTASLAANYATLIVCVLFLATLLLGRLGCKWTIVIAMTCFLLYFAAHFYPSFFPGMVIGGMFIGVGIGLVQTATNTYITMLAVSYAKFFKEDAQAMINKFFGIFHFIVFMARIWGNLTSSLLLTPNVVSNTTRNTENCGRTYIPSETKAAPVTSGNSSFFVPTDDIATSPDAFALYGTAAGVAVVSAILMSFFLDDKREEEGTPMKVLERAGATLRLVKEPRMFLLIPLTICFGIVEAYMSSDYTQAFVTCTIGIHNVGYVIICYGVSASLFSYLWGWLANRIGRIVVILAGTVVDIGAAFAMLYWHPNEEEVVIFYVLAALWGMADAVWRTQIYAFYGFIFSDQKEAGFSNLEVWMAVGLVIGYAWHKFLSVALKLIILLVVLVIGVAGYLSIEFIMWANKKRSRRMSTVSQLSS